MRIKRPWLKTQSMCCQNIIKFDIFIQLCYYLRRFVLDNRYLSGLEYLVSLNIGCIMQNFSNTLLLEMLFDRGNKEEEIHIYLLYDRHQIYRLEKSYEIATLNVILSLMVLFSYFQQYIRADLQDICFILNNPFFLLFLSLSDLFI